MHLRHLLHIALLIVLVSAAAPIWAADHYVRQGATGNGSGSDWNNACVDFTGSCAVASLVRGDTYWVADGNYASRNFNRAASGTSKITIKKATVAVHGTQTGWSDTFGDGQALFSNGSVRFSTDWWEFDGVVGGGPASWKTGFGFKVLNTGTDRVLDLRGGDNVTIRHVEAEGNGGDGDGGAAPADGIEIGNANCGQDTNVLVEYTYIHDTGRTIFFIDQGNVTVRYSWFARPESTTAQHAEGASIWCGTTGVTGVTFAYNVWESMEGTGVIVMDGSDLDVYGNIFWKSGQMGNGGVTTWTSSSMTNARIHNNTFADLNTSAVNFLGGTSNVAASNNVFFNNGPGFQGVSHSHNWFFNAGGTWGEGTAQTGSGDPFVSRANGDFHLTAHTNSGTTLAAPFNTDPDGNARGSGGIWDRGAFQFGGVAPPAPPTGLAASIR
jgi:hypothetical protein